MRRSMYFILSSIGQWKWRCVNCAMRSTACAVQRHELVQGTSRPLPCIKLTGKQYIHIDRRTLLWIAAYCADIRLMIGMWYPPIVFLIFYTRYDACMLRDIDYVRQQGELLSARELILDIRSKSSMQRPRLSQRPHIGRLQKAMF